jgi:hypothetical protein
MTSDLDTYRAAHLGVGQHGDDASIGVAMRADENMGRGDLDGQAGNMKALASICRWSRG